MGLFSAQPRRKIAAIFGGASGRRSKRTAAEGEARGMGEGRQRGALPPARWAIADSLRGRRVDACGDAARRHLPLRQLRTPAAQAAPQACINTQRRSAEACVGVERWCGGEVKRGRKRREANLEPKWHRTSDETEETKMIGETLREARLEAKAGGQESRGKTKVRVHRKGGHGSPLCLAPTHWGPKKITFLKENQLFSMHEREGYCNHIQTNHA